MSQKKHTPEPWSLLEVKNHSGRIKHLVPVDGEKMSILTIVENEHGVFAAIYNDEDARRIVACVNACAGMTDEQVSHGLVSASVFSSVVNQREELLKNLRFAVDLLTPIAGHTVQIERMRRAIASVEQPMEGGAA